MATIHDVAARAGVSATTVSHVINDTRRVSALLRERVETAMVDLGYQPNVLARSLRRKETFTIGLVVPDNANPFFAEVARGIEDTAYALGFSVILCNSDGSVLREASDVDLLLKRQVDGIILAPAGESASTLSLITARGSAVVLLDREVPGANVDCVLADSEDGAREAVTYLIGQGHRRIGCISGPKGLAPSEARLRGYRSALAGAGIPVQPELVVASDFHDRGGHWGALSLLNREERPTALFACNDLMAIGAISAASELGLSIPQELSVIGFDDIHLAAYVNPTLTSVAQPKYDMGEAACRMLVERLHERSLPSRRLVLPARLVIRNSSGAAPVSS